ncbi:MAG TPA: SPFH domain-containing protein [Candidatus Acidoferrales bacterium]
MLLIRFLLILTAFGFLACAAGLICYDIFLVFELDRILRRSPNAAASPEAGELPLPALPRPRRAIRLNMAVKLVIAAVVSLFLGKSIIVIPDGHAGIRVSQMYGVLPGTLYPGTHLIFPLFDRVQTYDIRDQVFATAAVAATKEQREVLTIDAKEGLAIGLGVTVRYRVDPQKLNYIQANVPQPLDEEVVEPVVTSIFREIGPNYVVRDIFSSKREEFRQQATRLITTRLAQDGIVVKEVLLGRVDLPEEYAQGLEGLLLKEQQDDQTDIEADIEAKHVKIADSQAQELKVREIRKAEADAQSQVIMAKAQSDSMQYTLPLKQKQIEQSRLEAEAAKETTLQNADAAAQAKLIDSKAEQQRQELLAEAQAQAKIVDSKAEQQRQELLAEAAAANKITNAHAEQQSEALLAQADADRIRTTAKAEGEQLQIEGAAIHENPLLIQKIIAERLSDKIQIMMVPNDGKYFFANDVLNSALSAAANSSQTGRAK